MVTPYSAEIITHLIQFKTNHTRRLPRGGLTRIHFASKEVVNDPRMISSARMFELEDDSLRYEMEMHTTAVEGLSSHLRAELRRGK